MAKLVKSFLDPEIVEALSQWIKGLFDDGTISNESRDVEGLRYGKNIKELGIETTKAYEDTFKKVCKLVESVVGEPIESTSIGYSIMYHLPLAWFPEHYDRTEEGEGVYRCNIMINKPEIGGQPVFDGEPLEVDNGDAWLFYGHKDWHGLIRSEGIKHRILLSFGFKVEE